MKQKKSVQRKRMNRRRIPAALVAAFTVTVSTLAILHQGVTTAEVDVDDGGIWVTNSSKKLVGHLNYDSRILDGAFRANTTEFDIGQSGNDVTFTDKTAHSVAPVDVAQVSLGAATSLPENARVVQGGSRLAVMDASGGQVWLSQVSSPSSTAYTDEGAVATDMDQGVATVSQKGTLFAISPRAGRRISVTREGQLDRLKSTDIKGLSANAELVITAVGEQPVALDTRNRVLVLPDGSLRNLADDGI
ncbi:MAG: fibronectin type III domain-containing protein, partial [Trueperella pyogenes]|nr:fibronectin type III domain-containing protein [Trueperella pyogenes]